MVRTDEVALITTSLTSKDKWPDNFHEDPECPGFGVWICGLCDGNGVVEHPWSPLDDEGDVADTESEEHHVEYVDIEIANILSNKKG